MCLQHPPTPTYPTSVALSLICAQASSTGTTLWVLNALGTAEDKAHAVAYHDSDQQVVAVGTYKSYQITFATGKTLTSEGFGNEAWVWKVTTTGTTQWVLAATSTYSFVVNAYGVGITWRCAA